MLKRIKIAAVVFLLFAVVAGSCFGSMMPERRLPDASFSSPLLPQQVFIIFVRVTVFEGGLVHVEGAVYARTFFPGDGCSDGLNWYAYCAGDPINSVDLWGLCPDDEYLKFATIPRMKYNDLENIPAWAVPLAIIGDLVPLVANTLGVIGNGVVGPANGVAWAAQNPNWSRDVLDYAHDAPIQFVQEQKDYFGSHTAEQVLEEAKNGFIAAVTNPRTLELGIAVCLTYGAGVKVGEYSNAGPGLNGKMFDTSGAGDGIKTTIHGAERIAGSNATRGGVLSLDEIATVRETGKMLTADNGTTVKLLQQTDGRFSVVVDGDKGLVTTFKNLSEKSVQRLSDNYGWK